MSGRDGTGSEHPVAAWAVRPRVLYWDLSGNLAAILHDRFAGSSCPRSFASVSRIVTTLSACKGHVAPLWLLPLSSVRACKKFKKILQEKSNSADRGFLRLIRLLERVWRGCCAARSRGKGRVQPHDRPVAKRLACLRVVPEGHILIHICQGFRAGQNEFLL